MAQPHKPAGSPGGTGGQFDTTGIGLAALPPTLPERDSPVQMERVRARLIKADADHSRPHPELDGERTELCHYDEKRLGSERKMAMSEVYKSVAMPDGGGTWNPRTGMSPVTGFCVSCYPDRSQVLPPDKLDPEDFGKAAKAFVDSNSDLYDKNPNLYLGLWNDPNTGKVYMDVSERMTDASKARQACKDHDQLAFYDLQTQSSAEVDLDATSGQKPEEKEKDNG